MLKNKILLLLLLTFLCTSCGYRFGPGSISNSYRTICVPYVEGDNQGLMTNALIRTFTQKGALTYTSCGSDLILRVCLMDPTDQNIGFIYAPKDKGDNFFSKLVVANEARLTLAAKIQVIDRKTGQCVLGPWELASFIDFDFEPDLSNVDEHAFSLGQLEMHNLAQDAAFYPLYNLLAEKIVDYVNHSW